MGSNVKMLQRGAKGEEVKRVQKALGLSGRDVDGEFGPQTEECVKKFQKENGLKVDGLVGPLTMAKLFDTKKLSSVAEGDEGEDEDEDDDDDDDDDHDDNN